MKKETKLRIFFFIITMCIIAHFLYYKWWIDPLLPLGLLLIGGYAPSIMLYSILPSKKERTPDYSKILSFAGIFVSLCFFVIYFSRFLGIWSNEDLALFLSGIALICFAILSWYKNGWWG